MDAEERTRLRGEILDELAPLLHERFAADAWGRLLIAVTRGQQGGGYRVAAVDVDDIVGDEAALERAFGGANRDDSLDALGAATEALAALAGVDLERAQGGTIVRLAEGGFAWLPGLVRAPSTAFEARRDGEVAELERCFRALPEPLRSARVDLDAEAGRVRFFDAENRPIGEAKGLLVGSFSRRSFAWLWGWGHRDLPEPMRREVKDVLDNVVDRSIWEVSERQFGSDEPTAWALCALFCSESKAEAALRLTHPDGNVFVAVYDVRASGEDVAAEGSSSP